MAGGVAARHFCSLTIEYHCYWLVGGHTRNSIPVLDGVVREFSEENISESLILAQNERWRRA